MNRVVAFTLGALLVAVPLRAQTEAPPLRERAYTGGGMIVAAPVGEFDDYVGTGWGLSGNFVIKLDGAGFLGARVGAGFVNYGHETKRVCFSQTVGCRVEIDLTTTNNIFFGNIGPELIVPAGPVRPYVNASVGFAYFATTSSVDDISHSGAGDIASTTNFDDVTLSWQVGAGLRIPVATARTPIYIDLGVRQHRNGEVEYLTEGGIIDNPDGSITLNPILSEADLLTFVIGVSVGLRW